VLKVSSVINKHQVAYFFVTRCTYMYECKYRKCNTAYKVENVWIGNP